MAYGINSAGTVVGDFFDDNGNGHHGFLYNAGSFTNIDLSFSAELVGINDAGQIIGNDEDLGSSGFLWSLTGAPPISINVPGLGLILTDVRGINDAGQVVGSFSFSESGSFVYDSIADSYTLLDERYPATDINNVGQIVGSGLYDGRRDHGVLYNHNTGSLTIIDVPGASSNGIGGINDAGQMVGIFSTVPEPGSMWLLGSGLVGICALALRKLRPS